MDPKCIQPLQSEDEKAQKQEISGSKLNESGCFGFRTQSGSSNSETKSSALSKFLSLFRSKSDSSGKFCGAGPSKSNTSLKSSASSKSGTSSKSSTSMKSNAPSKPHQRKRFVRVARDEAAGDPLKLNDNPHVVCKYTQEYLDQYYRRIKSEATVKSLPYETSEHTILKKSSTDPTPCSQPTESSSSPTIGKHATFKDVVQVIEYAGQDKVENEYLFSHEEQLQDDGAASKDKFFLNTGSRLDDESEMDAVEDSTEAKIQRLDSDSINVLPHVDLDRMDGIMRNIFSAVVTNADDSGLEVEPHKAFRRVELSELLKNTEADRS